MEDKQMESPDLQPDRNKVFIIYGRNKEARLAVEHFLRAVKLDPIDFERLASDLGGTPFIGDIVREGLTQAHGIVALFTPDEVSFLHPNLRHGSDQPTDLRRWQARPNVIFEAGMAYGLAPKRTILVTLGSEVSLFSDVSGIHILRLDNSVDSRAKFRQKLIGIGCSLDERTDNWTDIGKSGDFESCIQKAPEVGPRDPFR
jgi:predicted nucleotide-binding protein